jgi:hypothetical protein
MDSTNSSEQPVTVREASKRGGIAGAVGGWPGTMIALATALGGAMQAYQSYQEAANISRASYEALKTAVEQQGVQMTALTKSQAELKGWVEESLDRLERQHVTAVKAAARPRRAAPPVTAPMPEPPPPPAPAPVPAPATEPLPSFDQLAK